MSALLKSEELCEWLKCKQPAKPALLKQLKIFKIMLAFVLNRSYHIYNGLGWLEPAHLGDSKMTLTTSITNSRMIAVSKQTLIKTNELATSSRACAVESQRVYSKSDKRGAWRTIMGEAKKVLADAKMHNLTVDKPYLIKDGVVYGFFGIASGFCPLFGEEK